MKRKILNLCAAIIIVNSLSAQVDLSNGLQAYYPFNGNANDESSNSNDGVVHGATLAADRFGNPNSAYTFSGNYDYIQIENDSTISPKTALSMSVWAKPEDFANWNQIICKRAYRDLAPYNSYGLYANFQGVGKPHEWMFALGNKTTLKEIVSISTVH